jgi:adenylate kinase family enzyme
MKRVMIVGSSGAGKSTFAKRLGAIIGAPVVHLDALFWNPGWQECETSEFRRRVTEALAGDAWVTDGNYISKTFDLRVPRADAIIVLLQPRWRCMTRVLTRWLQNRGRTRDDIGPDCPEKIDVPFLQWVWEYERKSLPRLEAILRQVETRVVRLKGDAAARDYLARLASDVRAA